MSQANGSNRDELRNRLLGAETRAETRALTIFGVDIELRQPSFGSVMEARAEEDPKVRAARMVMEYACVPGSDERIFEEGDFPQILKWPFNKDLVELNKAIADLTGIDINVAEKELAGDPLEEQS